MSLRRPTVALMLFTFDISPFCDVAQTSDCGTHYLLFFVISPLCGVAPTLDCGIVILAFSSRGVIQTLVWHQHYCSRSFLSRSHLDPRLAPALLFSQFPLEESFRPSFGTSITILQFPLEASFRPSLGTQYLLSLCLNALDKLFICFMFTFVISYVRTVLRVLS